jgi:hypothetical protein
MAKGLTDAQIRALARILFGAAGTDGEVLMFGLHKTSAGGLVATVKAYDARNGHLLWCYDPA